MQRLIERGVLERERTVGTLPDPLGDPVTVHRAPGQRPENEDVHGSLNEAKRLTRHTFPSHVDASSCEWSVHDFPTLTQLPVQT